MNAIPAPRTSSRPRSARSGVACGCLATALLAALLLEACADDTPTAPASTDLPTVATMGVNANGTQIVIEPHWLTLDTIGVTGTFSATVIDAAGDTVDAADVTWESADTDIATVDTMGVVTSVALGKTKVTATHDSATAEATVEVALPLTDREILEILYEATGGDDWTDNTNWLSDEELSEWHGVDTNGNGRVTDLNLRRNELTGAIPAEIGGLSRLNLSDLSYNSITGHLPAELGKLTRLRRLEVHKNDLGGELPPEMGGMATLEYLDVAHNNNLGGTVPHTFAGLELETFYSTGTRLCTPPSLKMWFEGIPQTDNPTICTGRITLDPPSLYFEAIGDTATLSAMAMTAEGDTLHGAVVTWTSADTDIGTADSTGLVTAVDYGTTQVTAAIDSLTGTAEVEVVFKLGSREVLDSIYRLTGGESWTDTTNWLSDEPLAEWYGVETNEEGKVVGLSLGDNNLTGSIPPVLAELGNLVTLDLGGNALAGEIPRELGELQQLRDLLLNDNVLEGLLPRDVGYMAGLRYLHIGGNQLTGFVPPPFALLELDTLYAAGSGVCVPPSLGEWFEGIEQTDSAARCMDAITIEIVDLPTITFYAVGETADLTATYVSAEGDTIPEVPVTWSSGDTGVVSVSPAGRVTAVGDGETEVAATYDSTTATIAVEVALPENDRDVLEIFHDRARGGEWMDGTNWLSDEPLSEWAGVETDDSGRVVGLSLRDNNLRGSLHSSIGQLDQLVTLDLSRNWVSGSIPAEVGGLTLLRELVLSVNGLVGGLPSELGMLDSLRTLNVAATSLSGPVPAAFADLELETLLVNGTRLCVPPSLAAWMDSIAQTDNSSQCASRVSIEPSSLTFGETGDTVRLSVTVIGAEGNVVEAPAVTWQSADRTVARVDTTGLVTAIGSGITTVTATYDSVTAGAAEVAVNLPGGDRAALEAFYHATGGDDWRDNTNWLSDEPLGEWYGVDVREDGRVTYLELKDNNLTGQIPAAIGLLDLLFRLQLRDTTLTGPIPPAIGRLRRLRDLKLSGTGLDGPLPPEMGNMAGLKDLDLSSTRLSGPLPATFASLNIDRFYHFNTGLCVPRSLAAWYEATGNTDPLPCIPETADREVLVMLYNATGGPEWDKDRNWLSTESVNAWHGIATDDEGYVTEIFLPWNNMTDSIPTRLGDLVRLEVLALYGNELTGRIPPELGKLTGVRDLLLSSNNLEGPIPPELGGLVNVKEIILSNNQLTGPIPTEFGNLAELELLWLFNNQLGGPIPPELGNLEKLNDLSMGNNRLEGPLPPELGNLEALQWLIVHTNQLEGPLPPELGKLSKLKMLWLSRNQITGQLPSELGNLQALELLTVWQNQMHGPIPPELGNLSSLEELILSDNRFSGSIPPELGNLSNLEHLGLYKNQLTGPIPPELGNLSSLRDFWLSENQLTGTIPAELGKLSAVEDFGVQDNNLSGPIPREFGQMSSLVQLALYTNNLSGPLPPEIGNLDQLNDLRLEDNPDLEGLLPRSLLNLPLGHLYIRGTALCPQLDDEFQEWLDGIAETDGLECPTTRIEGFALAEFHAATGGASWTNNSGWDGGSTLSSRYGVTVAAGDSLVRQIRLPDNGLRGPLPPEIGNLRKLETLDLADNNLTGGIAGPITSIDALDTIRVGGNEDMEGALPRGMTEMTGLKALQYAGTDLYAPPSTFFQAWIDGLDIADGATCDNPEEVGLSLPAVYLTQAIQRPVGDVPLISGREALLRVFLVSDREQAFFEPEVVATFTRGGEEVHRVVMQSTLDRLATYVDEGVLPTSYNAVIPAEHIVDGTEFVVLADSAETIPRADGSETRYPASGSAALKVIEVPPLELTVVPVLYAENPDSSILPWIDSIAEMGAESPQVGLFRNSFPFSEFSAKTREPYVTSLDFADEDKTWDLILELEPVYRAERATGYWYAVADAPSPDYVRGIARLNGLVSFGKPWAAELAHEVGHNLNLEHAPCGGALGTDPDFPYSNGSIGVWGYDFRDGSLVSPNRRRDIMGYCYDLGWLSDYYFEKVIGVRDGKDETWTNGELAGAGPAGEMLVLWGGVLDGELRIEPVHSMQTTPKLPAEGGEYRIEGFGRGGQTEFSLSFTPGEDQYGNKYFFFAVPIEGDWEGSPERITLTGPEGEVTVDRNDPRSITVVTDPSTGRIRAILRDWNQALPAALGDTAGLEVVTTRGIAEAVRAR